MLHTFHCQITYVLCSASFIPLYTHFISHKYDNFMLHTVIHDIINDHVLGHKLSACMYNKKPHHLMLFDYKVLCCMSANFLIRIESGGYTPHIFSLHFVSPAKWQFIIGNKLNFNQLSVVVSLHISLILLTHIITTLNKNAISLHRNTKQVNAN